jgi:hypothetical protein
MAPSPMRETSSPPIEMCFMVSPFSLEGISMTQYLGRTPRTFAESTRFIAWNNVSLSKVRVLGCRLS